jgi:DNA-binding PadR family transcriptional regulator
MSDLNHTDYIILGSLHMKPRAGYDIKRFVDESIRFFWPISYGRLYPELKRLADLGLVTAEADSDSGRRRTVYRITEAGVEALRKWLASPTDPAFQMRDELLLKVFFSEPLTPEEALAQLRVMRARYESVLAHFRAKVPVAGSWAEEHGGIKPLVLKAGIAAYEGWLGLCDDAERVLRAELANKRSSRSMRSRSAAG